MTDVWMAALAGGVVTLAGKILFDWLKGNREQGDNGAAGNRSVAKWELRFAQIMHEVMEQRNPVLRDMMRTVIREEMGKR